MTSRLNVVEARGSIGCHPFRGRLGSRSRFEQPLREEACSPVSGPEIDDAAR